MPSVILLVLAGWLCLANAAFAQSDAPSASPDDLSAPPSDEPAAEPPVGPILQPADYAPVLCDPGTSGFRFVEVRGSGFDAWAYQRLVGNLLDGNGVPQTQWRSVWVSPQGRLTLEVNLCADPFRGRPALAQGTYTVSVGQGVGAAIAATSIEVSPPPEAPAEGEMPPAVAEPTSRPSNTGPSPTSIPLVSSSSASAPAPTRFTVALGTPVPTPGPRTGAGSRQQPFPLGAPGSLADGWQLVVTGVTPDAWSGIHSAVPSSIAPAADQRDYMVRVQAAYQGQGTGVFSAMRLALVSGTQTTYDQLHNGCGVVPDMVPPNLVTPAGQVRGNVCFAVRASDVDSLVLLDNQPSDSDKLYFSLR